MCTSAREAERSLAPASRLLALACGVAACGASTAAAAQERSLVVGLASGLIQRGVAYEPDAPTWLAAAHFYPAEGWSVGASGAMLSAEHRSGQSLQLIGQLSRGWPISGQWQGELALLHYEYPLDPWRAAARHDALRAALAHGERFSVAVTASPNANAAYASPYRVKGSSSSRGTLAFDLSARWPLQPGLAADVGVGYQGLESRLGVGHAYGHAGLQLSWRAAQFSLSYIATDAAAKRLYGHYAYDRWALRMLFQR